MNRQSRAESLGSGFYWVGAADQPGRLRSNPYLLVEGDEAVLFDPGSILDIKIVLQNISTVLDPGRIRYVVLHSADPDCASSVPYMESSGLQFTVVTHWQTWTAFSFYGSRSRSYLVDEHSFALPLRSGRVLRFVPTPYLDSPGAMATYDSQSRVLLSGNIFGAFGRGDSLYADSAYVESMKSYHEQSMPSNEILRPVMEMFSSMDISAIYPHHGAVIRGDVPTYIEALRNLECGVLLRTMRKDLIQAGGYRMPSEMLLVRYAELFGRDALDAVALSLGLHYDAGGRHIEDFPMPGEELWDRAAEEIYARSGYVALASLEPTLSRLSMEYSIKKPRILESTLVGAEKKADDLANEIARLRREIEKLAGAVGRSRDDIMRDPLTGLYNEAFFRDLVTREARERCSNAAKEVGAVAITGIDDGMARIEDEYGSAEVEGILKGIARVILESLIDGQIACRLHGATFALWMPGMPSSEASDQCELIRTKVESSRSFIEPVTISIGLATLAEARSDPATRPDMAGGTMIEMGLRRLRVAHRRGGNTICSFSEASAAIEPKARLLIVDDDSVNAKVLKTFFESAEYRVSLVSDGADALQRISAERFDVIISELMIPKIDGFMLKEALSQKSGTKDIPFILLSHMKDERLVVRAYNLGICHYLQKPYMLAEIMGIVRNLTSAGYGK